MDVAGVLFLSLAAAPASGVEDAGWVPYVVGFFVPLVAFLWMAHSNRQNRLRADELFKELQRRSTPSPHLAERDEKAYAQHVALNDLTAEKIKLEQQYLQMQMKIGNLEIEARERNEEYHRLMATKTELEIKSLKLHIREQTKRLDDYTGYDEE